MREASDFRRTQLESRAGPSRGSGDDEQAETKFAQLAQAVVQEIDVAVDKVAGEFGRMLGETPERQWVN